MLAAISILFFVFLALAVPVAFALGLATVPFFLAGEFMPLTVAMQRMIGALENFPLLAVPFFVLAGNLMNVGGITLRLLKFARLLTGWMAGGLGQVAIMLSALMGGISGSAVADAAMEARLLGDEMKKRGYALGFTANVIAFSSVITATIPPSIGLVLFGFVAEVSIGKLLLGGVIPGILMTVVLMVTTSIIAKKHGYKPETVGWPKAREVWDSFLECFWALVFPVFLIVGFRYGFFTATEAGAVVVGYALFVGTFIYRDLTWERFVTCMHESVRDIGMVMLIIAMAAVLGMALTFEQAPRAITGFLADLPGNKYVVLLAVMAVLFAAGMVMEATVNVLLVVPLLLPALIKVGFDPVHMGVVMVILITFGGNTPPVGVIMYTVCGILKCSFSEFVKWSWPFILAMLALITFLCLVPQSVLLLPNMMM